MKIDELEGTELDEAVFKARGWIFAGGGHGAMLDTMLIGEHCVNDIETTCYYYRPDGTLGATGRDAPAGRCSCPHRDIAQAWELDGEGWLWRFGDDAVTTGLLQVDLEVPAEGDEPPDELRLYVRLADFPSKAQAYATARCRAFLKAKGADEWWTLGIQ